MNSLPGLAVALVYLIALVGIAWLVAAGRHRIRQRADGTGSCCTYHHTSHGRAHSPDCIRSSA